jgi:copper oxidase (laccase) domain-containing protein
MAAVHAGWRGTLLGIVARTVELMQQKARCETRDVMAVFGPGSVNVVSRLGEEVVDQFTRHIRRLELLRTVGSIGQGAP